MKNKYDMIVVGGGFAGFSAAVTAAKKGLDVLLIEKYNSLGGAAVNSLVMPFMAFWTVMPEDSGKKYLCGNLFMEILDEMNKIIDVPVEEYEFDEEILKLVMNRLVKRYNVKVLFNTTVTDAEVKNGEIISIDAICAANRLRFFGDAFVDATGDGELSTLAGCEFMLGRAMDNCCQPMTLSFRMGGVDKEKYFKNRRKINELYKDFQSKGLIKNPRENVLIFDNPNQGVLHFNTTRIIGKNPVDPEELTEAEFEGREQVFEMLDFLRGNIDGFENARVLSTAMHIGIRESRKIVGEYVLNEQDLLSLKRFDDAIAVANYAIDIHSPDGAGTRCEHFGKGEWYEIPYRCLIPKGMKNMLVAGRCISSTHEAQSSYRIMPYCAELGQAVGTAVAVAHEMKNSLADVDVKKVQKILKEEGFSI